MTRMFAVWTLAILTLTCVCSTAHATALLEADWQTIGDGQLTKDTATGLEWLDLTASINQSFLQVSSEFGAAGAFAGFRYATGSEVFALSSDAGIPDLSGAWNPANFEPVLALEALVGITFGSFGASIGVTGDDGISSSSRLAIMIQANLLPNSPLFQQARVLSLDAPNDDASSFLGNWLVRSAQVQVPVPSTLWLFGLAVAIFLLRTIAGRTFFTPRCARS